MFLAAISLPLATRLVSQPQDDRSQAAETITSSSQVSFKLAFKGVKSNYTCLSSLTKIKLEIANVPTNTYESNINASITPVSGETNTNGDQVFLVSNLALDSKFNSVNNFNYLRVKGPSHLASRMCLNHQTTKLDEITTCDINLSNTNTTVYDFTNYALIPGDINQDGMINSTDYSIVKNNFNSSSEITCNQTGDLNLDGIVNSLDANLLKEVLSIQEDSQTIDVLTPTPTDTKITDEEDDLSETAAENDDQADPTSTAEETTSGLSYEQLIQPLNMSQIKKTMSKSEYKFKSNGSIDFSYIVDLLPPKGTNKRSDIIKAAQALLGAPYWMGGGHRYSGNSEHIAPGIDPDWGKKVTASSSKPNAKRKYHGLDCSGFTRWVYKYVTGKNPGNKAANIYGAAQKISKAELKPGDIGFVSHDSGNHIGIFVGKGTDGKYYFIHSAGYSSKAGPQGLGGILISAYKFNRFGRIKVNLLDN